MEGEGWYSASGKMRGSGTRQRGKHREIRAVKTLTGHFIGSGEQGRIRVTDSKREKEVVG